MPLGSGFAQGWLDTGNALLGQQNSQLQQALEIANAIMRQRQAAHQQQMDEWQRTYQDRMAKVAEQNAKTTEQYRTDQAEENKRYHEEQQKQKAWDNAEKALSVGISPGEAFARVQKLDPEGYAARAAEGLANIRARRMAEYQSQPAPQAQPYVPPQIPLLPGAEAAPQQAMPSPVSAPAPEPVPEGAPLSMAQALGGLGLMGLPGAMGMAGRALSQAPQVPVAAPQETPMGPAGPAVPPLPEMPLGAAQAMQGPQLAPMMVTPQPAPFVEPTMQDWLRSQSPQFLAKQAQDVAKAKFMQIRGDVLQRGADLNEQIKPAQIQERIAHDMAREEDARKRTDIQQNMTDARIKNFRDQLDKFDQQFRERTRMDDNLIQYRDAMTNIRQQNANTAQFRAQNAQNGLKALGYWERIQRLRDTESKRADDLEKKRDDLSANFEQAMSGWWKAQKILDATPDQQDPTLLKTAMDEQAAARAYKNQLESVTKAAAMARKHATTLSNIADNMQNELHDKGVQTIPRATVTPMPRQQATPLERARQGLLGGP